MARSVPYWKMPKEKRLCVCLYTSIGRGNIWLELINVDATIDDSMANLQVIEMNKWALAQLPSGRLEIVPGATHLVGDFRGQASP